MKSNTLHLRRAVFFVAFIFGIIGGYWGQNALNSGDFSGGSWESAQSMGASAGSTLILTKSVTSSGDKYFRFYGDGSPCGEYQANSGGDYFTHGIKITSPNANCGSLNAWRINVPTSSSNVVFKNDGQNDGVDASVAFVIQGTVRSISSLTQVAAPVLPNASTTVSVSLDGALPTGQSVWLRYATISNFSNSTCVKMTGSGTSYSANIPSATNTAGTTVYYYAFTSGDGSSISGTDADLFTINLMNNSGSNYSYTVASNFYSKSTGNLEILSNWGTATDGSGTAPVNFTTAGVTYNIRNNATPTIGASWTVSGTSSKIVVGDGTNACNFTVPGTFIVTSPTTNVSFNGTITRSSSGGNNWGTLTFSSGATYVHNVNLGTLPSATWHSNSTLQIDDNLSADQFTQSFGNVKVNNNAAFFISTSNSTYTGSIQGDFIHNSSGAISLKNSSWNATFTIGGNLSITGGGTLRIMEGVGTSLTKTHKIIVNGSFSLSNGTINLSNETGSTSSASAIFEVKGDFSHTGGTISETGTSTSLNTIITLTGTTGTQAFESLGQTGSIDFIVAGSNSQCVVSATKTFLLSSASTMTIGAGSSVPDLSIIGTFTNQSSTIITTSGTWAVNNGGTYIHNTTTDPSTPFNSATFNSGSTVIYRGSSTLTPGSTFNGRTYHHLSFESTSGTMPAISATGTSALVIIGNLTVGANCTFNCGMTGTPGHAIKGNITLGASSTLNFNSASAGTFNLNGTTQTVSNSGAITTSVNVILLVGSSTTFDLGAASIGGSGTFQTSNGSTLITANTLGINGNLALTTKNLNSGTNYIYNGGASQVVGSLVTSASNLTINNSSGVSLSGGISLTTLTLTNGALTVGSTNTITISSSGSITATSGSLASGTGAGTFTFSGTGTISGTIGFNHVNIAGGVNFGTASTINGTLSINTGGFVNTNAPIYASGSTLKYNSGGTYGRGTEWSATSAAGYPHHVQISNGTILYLGANSGTATARQIAGNMTVDANGATLSMAENPATSTNPMTAALTVKGNYFNYGTTFLSSSIGGDLILEGDLTDNATFTANGRAIFFQGSNIQSIFSSDNPLDIDVARFNKTDGEVILSQNLLIDETADPVQFAGTSILNLNGFAATFGKSNTASSITMNSTSAIKGSANSHLTIYGNGAFGTINFDQTTPGTSNQLGNLLIQRSSGSVTLGNALSINGSLTLSSGKLIIGANTLTLAGTVASMNETNCLVGSSSSNLIVSGTGTLGTLYFDQTTPGTTNYLNTFNLNRTSSGTMNLANNLQLASLTITNGEFIQNSSQQLTVNGVLTNNGILTLNSGATLVQGTSSAIAGSGTYNVKQYVTGSGGSTPNGRFWYLGSPLSNGSSTALLSNNNLLWQWNEGGSYTIGYATVSSGQTLTQGRSYVLRSGQNETINFSGTSLSNGTVPITGLTRTGTTQQFRGCHLVSNPYPSYLDWNAITKTNIGTTMYVRTAVNTTYDILETFNSTGSVATNNSGTPLTQYIAPMQGFWVKVTTDGQTGSLTMNNSMRSHQASGSGLRSTAQDFPAFLRFNMIDGQNKDQVILLMSPDASMSLDAFDSEKMSATGYAQFYSTVNATKLVINGMKNVKAKTSVPLTLVMPTSKSYTFQAEEFNIEDGLILLEDKQEGVIQDLTVNPTYPFFGNAGTNATRFVIHFQLATAPVLVGGPQELESLGSDELMSDNIQIVSNNQGTVIVRLDEGFKPEGSIRIFDASGRMVEQSDFNDQETTIHLNEQAGMYFVEVNAGKLMVKKKIVIE
jgi:hypothetical protein